MQIEHWRYINMDSKYVTDVEFDLPIGKGYHTNYYGSENNSVKSPSKTVYNSDDFNDHDALFEKLGRRKCHTIKN